MPTAMTNGANARRSRKGARHVQPFDARVVATLGEIWLTRQGPVSHLKPGYTFTLMRDEQHALRYGPHGTTCSVARRRQP